MPARKLPHPFARGPSRRAPTAAPRSTAALPTIAALVSALAIVTATHDAHAIVRTTDSGPDDAEIDDAATDADPDATADAAYCEPREERIAGGMPPTRIHGTGCGCGSSGDDDATAALITTTALGLAFSVRSSRRRPTRS